MDSQTSTVNTGGLISILRLFFGGSFSGIGLLALAGLFPFWLGVLVSILGALLVRRVLRRNGRELPRFRWVALMLLTTTVAQLVFLGLAALSASGALGADHSSQNAFEVEKDLVILAGWLVLGVPHRAFRIGLDPDGDGYAQRVFLRLLVMLAVTMTGVAIFLLHFGNGVLKRCRQSGTSCWYLFYCNSNCAIFYVRGQEVLATGDPVTLTKTSTEPLEGGAR
jgi:hypothetical protein